MNIKYEYLIAQDDREDSTDFNVYHKVYPRDLPWFGKYNPQRTIKTKEMTAIRIKGKIVKKFPKMPYYRIDEEAEAFFVNIIRMKKLEAI
jgi:hypothetical protein